LSTSALKYSFVAELVFSLIFAITWISLPFPAVAEFVVSNMNLPLVVFI
jgi:hypothetical protein